MAEHLIDRSHDLDCLTDDCLPPSAPTHRHPRNMRIVPKSRDFH
jgi:hypothetical protein